APALRLRF
uniref:FMRFamide-like neuropeptide FLP4 n=1 Tax=Macrobrachium rosenbergii TaxID=79674 RepID=FAR4_MACRS|nr:RecName: Full=FMRFamide-like neuropeptide FLP4; AltName: Full=APALRLRF-amide [Macrobrachium rosenbergii]